jgi:uncharacterized protein
MGTSLQPDLAPGLNRITAYRADAVRVGATEFSHSVLVLPEGTPQRWEPSAFEHLSDDHLRALAAQPVEVILIGTGTQIHLIPPSRLARFFPRTGVECMTTDAACRTFNLLASEGRKVLAALIVPPHSSNLSPPECTTP